MKRILPILLSPFLLVLTTGLWAQTISVSSIIDPDVKIGDIITVDVTYKDISNLVGFDFYLFWNMQVLQFYGPQDGESALGPTIAQYPHFIIRYDHFNGLGYLRLAGVLLGAVSQYSEGVLASFQFKVVGVGNSYLRMDLYDGSTFVFVEAGVVIPYRTSEGTLTAENGTFSNDPSIVVSNVAELVKRKAWPERHHFSRSSDADGINMLKAKVKNLSGSAAFVRAKFTIRHEGVLVGTLYSDAQLVKPSGIALLSSGLTPPMDGKYSVSARAMHSLDGANWSFGSVKKSFRFTVVP